MRTLIMQRRIECSRFLRETANFKRVPFSFSLSVCVRRHLETWIPSIYIKLDDYVQNLFNSQEV